MNRSIQVVIGVLVPLMLAGCAEHTRPTTEFPEEGSLRPHQRMSDIQRANGARGDGNLYAVHFTGDALNSLGRAKLGAMLRDDESVRPLTVHIAPAPDRDVLLRRIESVTAYLKDNGLTDQQMHFVSGLNDASYHRSASGLANLHKMDSVEPGARGGDTGTNGAGAGDLLIK
jgi:hypothetical protein